MTRFVLVALTALKLVVDALREERFILVALVARRLVTVALVVVELPMIKLAKEAKLASKLPKVPLVEKRLVDVALVNIASVAVKEVNTAVTALRTVATRLEKKPLVLVLLPINKFPIVATWLYKLEILPEAEVSSLIDPVATERLSITLRVVVAFVTVRLTTELVTVVEVPTVKFPIVVLPTEKSPLTTKLPFAVRLPTELVNRLVFSIHVEPFQKNIDPVAEPPIIVPVAFDQ